MFYRVGREFFSKHPHLMAGILGSIAKRVPQGIRYGREFRRTRRFLADSQWWSRERLEAYQLTKLKETIRYAYDNIPYYRKTFDGHGVAPEDLQSLADIRKFPTLTKETLLDNFDSLLAPHLDRRKLMPYFTGGTTGSGVRMLFEEHCRQRSQAFIWRMWNNVGYRHGMLAAILQHRECPEDINDGIWYMDRVSNAMILSAHRLSRETITRYVEALERYRPKVLIAYPSLAHLLCTYGEEIGWRPDFFELILCGSETLYGFQRERLRSFFNAPVRIHYGHIESCALFGYCERSDRYHIQLEYGFVEFLKEDGSEAGPGEVGEIVATGFENRAVPLIRFRTDDWAEVSGETCSCGRNYPLVERIQGRGGDFIRTPSGKAHSPIIIEVLMDDMLRLGYSGFADLQIAQDRPEQVVVKVVRGKTFSQEQLDHFCKILDDRLEHEVEITTELVDQIPRTPRQKKSLVISKVPDRS